MNFTRWAPSRTAIVVMWSWLSAWQIFSLAFFSFANESETHPFQLIIQIAAIAGGCVVTYPAFARLNRTVNVFKMLSSWLIMGAVSVFTSLLSSPDFVAPFVQNPETTFPRFIRLMIFTVLLNATFTVLVGTKSYLRNITQTITENSRVSAEQLQKLHEESAHALTQLRRRIAGPLVDMLSQIRLTQDKTSLHALSEEFRVSADVVRMMSRGMNTHALNKPQVPKISSHGRIKSAFHPAHFVVIYALVTPLAPFVWDSGVMGFIAGVVDIALTGTIAYLLLTRLTKRTTWRDLAIAAIAALIGSVAAQLILYSLPGLPQRILISTSGAVFGLLIAATLIRFNNILKDVSSANHEMARTTAEISYANEFAHYTLWENNVHIARILHSAIQGKLAAASAACSQAVSGFRSEPDARSLASQALNAILLDDIPALEMSLDNRKEISQNPWTIFRSRWDAYLSLSLPLKVPPEHVAAQVINLLDEVASNAIKHGHATELRVCMEVAPRQLSITATNNGNPIKDSVKPGFGSQLYTELVGKNWTLVNSNVGVVFTALLKSEPIKTRR